MREYLIDWTGEYAPDEAPAYRSAKRKVCQVPTLRISFFLR